MKLSKALSYWPLGVFATVGTGAVAAMVTAGTVAIATAPASAATPGSTASATVRSYNDGFTDAKLDDCQQGFSAACTWVHHAPAVPPWLHVQPAPRRVARDACGRWPQYGLGTDKRGQVVPGVLVWPVDSKGRQVSDGFVACESGKVAMP